MVIPLRDDNPTVRFPVVTVLLIVVNCFVYFSCSRTAAPRRTPSPTSTRPSRASSPGAPLTVGELVSGDCEEFRGELEDREAFPDKNVWFSVLVSMFLHATSGTSAATCCSCGSSGTTSRTASATSGTLVFYLAAGVVATATHVLADLGSMQPLIGASGAIAGVMGAYLVLWPTRPCPHAGSHCSCSSSSSCRRGWSSRCGSAPVLHRARTEASRGSRTSVGSCSASRWRWACASSGDRRDRGARRVGVRRPVVPAGAVPTTRTAGSAAATRGATERRRAAGRRARRGRRRRRAEAGTGWLRSPAAPLRRSRPRARARTASRARSRARRRSTVGRRSSSRRRRRRWSTSSTIGASGLPATSGVRPAAVATRPPRARRRPGSMPSAIG